jgi:hypothetical protein
VTVGGVTRPFACSQTSVCICGTMAPAHSLTRLKCPSVCVHSGSCWTWIVRRVSSGCVGVLNSLSRTRLGAYFGLKEPQGSRIAWNVTITCATPSVLSGGTLGVCASIFLSLSSVFLSLNELYDSGVRPDRIQDRAGSCRVAQTSMVTSKLRLAHR